MLSHVSRSPNQMVNTPRAVLKKACDCAESGVVRAKPMRPPTRMPVAFKIAPVTRENQPRLVLRAKRKVRLERGIHSASPQTEVPTVKRNEFRAPKTVAPRRGAATNFSHDSTIHGTHHQNRPCG